MNSIVNVYEFVLGRREKDKVEEIIITGVKLIEYGKVKRIYTMMRIKNISASS